MIKLLDHIKNCLTRLPESRMLIILAILVGLGSGFAAVILKNLIHFFQWILTGWFNTPEDSFLYFLYPGVGMLAALLLVKYVVRDNIGHGVTKVLLAVSRNESKIKSHNVWSSLPTSAVTIGFGGSVGAEAPIVYTGAAIGSNVARLFGLSYRQMTILLGCGAAGAVSGIFAAPLAGVLFTLEILLFNISMTSILPFVISSITATVVAYAFLGPDVAFENSLTPFVFGNIPYYLLLGVVCGFGSLYFIRVTLSVEDRLKSIPNIYVRWAFAALGLGLLIFLFPPLYGEGYGSLTNLLNGDVKSAIGTTYLSQLLTTSNSCLIPLFFLSVFFFKVFSMSLTNAGGGVGGTFGPTLFMGGVLGFVVARVLNLMGMELPETNFALVAMAGLMSGVMQAPLTAIFLIAEITRGYELLMPLIITSAVSFATIRFFERYSIYTKRIAKQGDLLTHDSDKAVLTLLNTANLVENDFIPVKVGDKLGTLVKAISNSRRNLFPVLNDLGELQGVVYLDDLRQIMFNREMYDTAFVYNFMKPFPETVSVDEKMESVMKKFEVTDAWNLPVLDSNGLYLGFVSKSKIFSAYRERLHQVSHD